MTQPHHGGSPQPDGRPGTGPQGPVDGSGQSPRPAQSGPGEADGVPRVPSAAVPPSPDPAAPVTESAWAQSAWERTGSQPAGTPPGPDQPAALSGPPTGTSPANAAQTNAAPAELAPGPPGSGQPGWAPPAGSPGWGQPPGQPGPDQAYPPAGADPAAPAGKPRKRRGVLIAAIALAVALVLCGGGGLAAFLLLRNSEPGPGAPDPVAAVDRFLTAVYNDQDATQASNLVCAEARDPDKIKKKVDEVRGYAQTYRNPRYRWDPPKVDQQSTEQARVSATVTMTTGDEKTAQQALAFTVLKKDSGWRVCEIAG